MGLHYWKIALRRPGRHFTVTITNIVGLAIGGRHSPGGDGCPACSYARPALVDRPQPFECSFLDESFNAQYDKDRTTQLLFNIFTGLAILISCLGLYGLVSLLTLQ